MPLGVKGCPAYQYTLQSAEPFVQPPYQQFTEVRNGHLQLLSYQGRVFTVSIGAKTTTVTLDSGSAVLVEGPKKTETLAPGGAVTMPTGLLDTSGCS